MNYLQNNSIKYKNRKIVFASKDAIIAVKGYSLYRDVLYRGRWEKYAMVKDNLNALMGCVSLSRRFTRAEITKYYQLYDGTELCIARKGIFRKAKDEGAFTKVFNVVRGSRPMNICEDKDGCLYFGEYFANMEKQAVHIYKSADAGLSWSECYTFPEGNINHVHGIFMDPFTKQMWLATGDRENECIIGYTNDGFKSFTEVFRGDQEYRTCVLFFYKDFIVFGTDSQYQQNELKKFDRNTLEITHLQDVQGPVIRGAQFGDISMISTDVEPSDVNKDKNAYVWITRDGLHWEELCHAEKDCLNPTLFQFGVFDLPQYAPDYKGNKVYVTGKAVKGCGGDTLVFDINEK